jgi:hypothetical protein
MPFTIPSSELINLPNPNSGMLCYSVYWRPRPTDPDPEMPGEKASIISFLPVADNAICPCSSGKLFHVCCQIKPYWQVICPNPALQGYDLLAPQSMTFTNVNGDNLGPKLMDDERLYCIENTRKRAFWSYWGDPALLAPEGTLCFGDFELLNAQKLIVTALSSRRTEILLSLLRELVGDSLGKVQIEYDKVQPVKKPGYKERKSSSHQR